MGESGAELKGVVAQALALIPACLGPILATILVSTTLLTACDILLDPQTAMHVSSMIGLLTLYLDLLVTAQALEALGQRPADWDPRRPTSGRYPRAFVISLATGLAALAGGVLLILPGIVLLLRWSLAYPVLLADNGSVAGTLRRSWNLTRRREPLLIGYGLLVLAGYAAAVLIMFVTYPDEGRVPAAPAVAANLAMVSAQLWNWLLTAALYARLREAEAPVAGAQR